MRRIALIAPLAILFFAAPAFAQLSLPGGGNSLTIGIDPVAPRPGDRVALSLSTSLYDLDASTITWQVNGTTIASGVGVKNASFRAGALGSADDISVELVDGDAVASAETRLTPASVDLLWESDSYVPPFYRGRALPTPGTSIRLFAIPYLTKTGRTYAADQLIYTWKVNGAVVSSLSGRGKASARIPAPDLFDQKTVTVDVASPDKSVAASASVTISTGDPLVRLYEDHPLFGVEYFRALPPNFFLNESEMTFIAIPYFAKAQRGNSANLTHEWRVNGTPVAAAGDRTDEITLSAGNTGGLAHLELSVGDRTNILSQAAGTWDITFTKSGGAPGATSGGASSPFGDH
ncbi:MAG: hypothetical protein JO019_04100 [Candidatus Kaiserbacteria bacterium]|nr:hypothetical protein [Candidatus Kaiserbacteria bacterium]